MISHKILRLIFFLILFGLLMPKSLAQSLLESPPVMANKPRLSLYAHSYPMGLNDENFKNFRLDYGLTDKLGLQLQYFYSKYGTYEGVNTSLLFKWYVKKNLYLFAGPEVEFGTNQATGQFEPLRVNLNFGVGYEVNPDMLLELGIHPEIGPPATDAYGRSLGRQNSFSLRASF